jgi:hypothetical protein
MGLLWIGFKILEKKDSAKQGVSGSIQICNSAVPLFKLTGLAKSNFTFQVGCPGCSEGHPGWVIKRICNPPTHGSRPKHHFQRSFLILGCPGCSEGHPGCVILRICNPPTRGSQPKQHFQRPLSDSKKIAAAAYQILGCHRCPSEHQVS